MRITTKDDLITAIAAIDSIPGSELKSFLKSEYGILLLKAVKQFGEQHSAEKLHEHPARGTEGKDKSKWGRAVEAATQKGKKKASYALSQYIFNKMNKSYGEFVKAKRSKKVNKDVTDAVSMKNKKDLIKPGFGLFGEQTSYGA